MAETFIIGDVHGHIELLNELLEAANLDNHKGARVIQIGDLGHYGWGTKDGDSACWELTRDKIDTVIMGNHERAIVDRSHAFAGYQWPHTRTVEMILAMHHEGRLKMAEAIDGWLLTHAGLHDAFVRICNLQNRDAKYIAMYLNKIESNGSRHPVINNIPMERGGDHPNGGILWRDARELLWRGVPQIFGHTARNGRVEGETDKWWNIDAGVKEHGTLAGLWLPSQEIVQVGGRYAHHFR